MTNIGAMIKYHREKRGMTLKDVAERSGVSLSYLSDIERGRSKLTVIDTLRSVAGAMGMTLQEFFESDTVVMSADEYALLDAWRDGDYATILKMVAERLDAEFPLPEGALEPKTVPERVQGRIRNTYVRPNFNITLEDE